MVVDLKCGSRQCLSTSGSVKKRRFVVETKFAAAQKRAIKAWVKLVTANEDVVKAVSDNKY